MNEQELKNRTKQFCLRAIKLVGALPAGRVGDVVGRQLAKAASSVAANYRAACRGRSRAEFVAKLGIVEEECDEAVFWIDLVAEAGLVPKPLVTDLLREGNEILAIPVASRKTARRRIAGPPIENRKSKIEN
jgi:four helix bundle protein